MVFIIVSLHIFLSVDDLPIRINLFWYVIYVKIKKENLRDFVVLL